MTDQPKKRRWFQFHLSTAIVLMFVAGGLIWANVRMCEIPVDLRVEDRRFAYGWPVSAIEFDSYPMGRQRALRSENRLRRVGLAIDIATAILIIGATGFGLEWRTRRGERRS